VVSTGVRARPWETQACWRQIPRQASQYHSCLPRHGSDLVWVVRLQRWEVRQILPIKCEFLAYLKTSTLCSQSHPEKAHTNSLDSALNATIRAMVAAFVTHPFICFPSSFRCVGTPEECFILSALALHKKHNTKSLIEHKCRRIDRCYRVGDG